MTQRGYQRDFASTHQAMYSDDGRRAKADTLVAVLRDGLGARLATARVLNVGCSTGIMDSFVAPHVGSHVGIDIDEAAVRFATATHQQPNLSFRVGDAMALDIPDASVDAVICSQVYEHVPDPKRLMDEIHRVLAPGGVCYFAATNRLCIVEQHYFLPFLSIMPVWMAHRYLRLTGRGTHYYERHLVYWNLRRLVAQFRIEDYTRKILAAPADYHAEYLFSTPAKLRIARTLARVAYWAFPGYIWLLRRVD